MRQQRWARVFIAAVAALCSASLTGPGTAAAGLAGPARGGSWGTGLPDRGSADLSVGLINSVSCASAGNCSAGGGYMDQDQDSGQRPAVADEDDGIWGPMQKVDGLPPGPAQANGSTMSVSCASAGNCSAGGYYESGDNSYAFVVSEKDGIWGRAQQVPGLARFSKGRYGEIMSVSCSAAGECAAGGDYTSKARHGSSSEQPFVVSERDGTWGRAQQIPGLPRLNTGRIAQVYSVSCGAAGNCAAGGSYSAPRGSQAFVVSERNRHWGRAEEVPGLARVSTGRGGAQVVSVSCGAAGHCSAGGYYSTPASSQAFVVSEKNGTWGRAEEVRGLARLNKGRDAQVNSVSCAPAGNCSAGGSYYASENQQAFVVSERHGTWGRVQQVPGLARLKTEGSGQITSVSCASAGNCSAAGSYGYWKIAQPFVVNEKNGTWGRGEEVPGIAALNEGLAGVASISCASAGNCSAGGSYAPDYFLGPYPLVVGEKNRTWGNAQTVLAQP